MVARLLHLVDEPIPVASGFDGDVGGFGERVEVGAELVAVMFNADRWIGFAVLAETDKYGVTLVGITAQDGFLHGRTEPRRTTEGAFIRSPRGVQGAATPPIPQRGADPYEVE